MPVDNLEPELIAYARYRDAIRGQCQDSRCEGCAKCGAALQAALDLESAVLGAKAKIVCAVCGSDQVHEEICLDPNTGLVVDHQNDYCRACNCAVSLRRESRGDR